MSNPSCSVAAEEAYGSRSSPTGLLHGASRRTRPSCWPERKCVRKTREHGRARMQQGRDEEQQAANRHSMNEERVRYADHATTNFMSLLSYLVVGILGLLVVEASSLLIVTSLSVKGGSLFLLSSFPSTATGRRRKDVKINQVGITRRDEAYQSLQIKIITSKTNVRNLQVLTRTRKNSLLVIEATVPTSVIRDHSGIDHEYCIQKCILYQPTTSRYL